MFDRVTENSATHVTKSRLLTALLLLIAAIIVSAPTAQAQTTTFTYQGRLTDAGVPASGMHDFELKLYDATGSQVGATLTIDDVLVTGGLFTVQLDFGVSPFASATATTLEIGVRPGASTGAFTVLAPRQPITSSPYSIKTLNAAQLDGIASDQFVQTTDPRLSDARPPSPGNSNYIQNQTAASQAAGFNISGDGVIGGKVGIGTNAPTFALDIKAEDAFGNTTARITSSRQAAILSLDSTISGQNQVWNVESGILGNPGLFGILNRNTLQARLTIDPGGRVNIPGNLDVGQTLSANTLSLNIVNANTQYNIGGQRVLSSAGTNNVFVGVSAGAANAGTSNAFFGAFAGQNNTAGGFNTFVGAGAGQLNQTGGLNSFFGAGAGLNNTESHNSFFGTNAGLSNNTGSFNSFFGRSAGFSNNASFNAFFGAGAGELNTTGTDNSFFGTSAGGSNIIGSNNSFFGRNAGLANAASFNSFFGFGAGEKNTAGNSNAFFGSGAGYKNTTANDNAIFGAEAGFNNTIGTNNAFFGRKAGFANIDGQGNTFLGALAGRDNVSGNNNTFVGSDAGKANTTGNANSLFGLFAGANNTTGIANSFFGVNAGFGNTSGGFNSFFGAGAGSRNSTGAGNTFVGIGAGQVNTVGNDNAFLGNNTGISNLSGSNITLIGTGADVGSDNLSNASAVGVKAFVSQNNSLVLGSISGINGATSDTNVGIGTSAPSSKLTVAGLIETTNGGVKFPDGTIQTTAASAGSISDITAGAGLTGGGTNGNLTLDVGAGPGINVAADTISIADSGVTTTKLADASVMAPKIAAGQVVKSVTVGTSTLRDDLTLAAGSGIAITPAGTTLTIAATGGGGGLPDPGSPNYIQNTTTTQAGANFNVDGNGRVGGTFFANNVGIGTVTPIHRLSIEGSGFTESSIRSTNERAILSLDSNAGGQRRIWTLESGVGGSPGLFGIYDRTAGQARLVIGPNGNVGIGTSFLGSRLTVDGGGITSLGFIRVLTVGVQGNMHLCRSSLGFISFCSSSLRYKTDLRPFSDGLKFINQLRPVSFKWKSDSSEDVGFGAEDVAKVNSLFVTYNDKGKVEGVKYDRLSVVFVNAFKEQQAQIERQQKQIDELKKLVCIAYPAAAEACKQ